MNKLSKKILNISSCFLLASSLTISAMIPSNISSAKEDVNLKNFSSIERKYDKTNNNLIRYHYENENGNKVKINNKSTNNKKKSLNSKKAASLPTSYDLRDYGLVTSIKDQGFAENCWAFAALKSMESSLVKNKLLTLSEADLSENHLSWYAYHSSETKTDPIYQEGFAVLSSSNYETYFCGGSAPLAQFVLARGNGAVMESKAPFFANNYLDLNTMAEQMSAKNDTLRYLSDFQLTDSSCYDDATDEQIKQAIINKGAIDVAFYYSYQYLKKNSGNTCYYQRELTGDDAINYSNHCVTIIGWDDNFSKDNFDTYKPSSNGAWLIANSSGSSFGDNGCYWISYEEPSLNEFYTFTSDTKPNYDTIYQYDGSGWGTSIANTDSPSSTAANIYTADTNHTQSMDKIGLYTISDHQPYTIKVYTNVTAGKPDSGKLSSTYSGTADYQGYHVIQLKEPVSLSAGELFSIVVSYDNTNQDTGYIPFEGSSEYFPADYDSPASTITCTSKSNQSFLYSLGTNNTYNWYDTSQIKINGSIKNNFCVKAFAKNVSAVGNISISNSKVTLGVKETFTPKVTVSNISDKTVTYKSSNSSIASVNKQGKITAKKTGTAKITATIASQKSKIITVTVKNAPTSITTNPKNKKTIKVKKYFTITTKLPANSASHKITFSSSKKSVAKVNSSGKVTALKKGKATITIKTYNNQKTYITVTVK